MNKSALIVELSEKNDFSRPEAEKIIEVFFTEGAGRSKKNILKPEKIPPR